MPSDRTWISSLTAELDLQKRAISALLDFCEQAPLVTSLSVGCSLGRGAADVLSDIDAAIGVDAPRGAAGAESVRAVENATVEFLPGLGRLVDVLRQETKGGEHRIRRVFAQFDDRLQLDLAVVPEPGVRRGDAAPDFVAVYWQDGQVRSNNGRAAREVSVKDIEDWVFLGWRALLDADKYLTRGSLWEAHHRLEEARDLIWKLWAAAHGAMYPWHGLSQVLDHDPDLLPPGIEATVAGLDGDDLRIALVASTAVLDEAGFAAADKWGASVNTGMAKYARRVVTRT